MGFTIKQIKAILSDAGVPTENITATAESICERHKTEIDAIKEERDTALESAKNYDDVKKELDELKDSNAKNAYKDKYDALKSEYEKYKTDIESAKTLTEKQNAYRAILKELHISKAVTEKIVKLANFDELEFADGKFTKADEMKKAIGDEWKDFIVSSGTNGGKVDTPPANNGTGVDLGKLSMAEYIEARKKM